LIRDENAVVVLLLDSEQGAPSAPIGTRTTGL